MADDQHLTIDEAITLMRGSFFLADKNLRVAVEACDDQRGRNVEFGVWDGDNWYYAPDLRAAVHQCLAAYNEAPSGSAGDANAFVGEAHAIATGKVN